MHGRHNSHIVFMLLCVVALSLMSVSSAYGAWADSTYVDWTAVSGLPGQGSSPHGGYSSTTVKCSVCHSVHGANAAGEALLASTRAEACSYCHISTSVSSLTVYGGDVNNYSGTDLSNAHNSDVGAISVTCVNCHQVHAATDDMTANAYLTTKLLTGVKTDLFGAFYDDLTVAFGDDCAPLAIDGDDLALTKWCTKCHKALSDPVGGDNKYGWDQYDGQAHVLVTDPSASGRDVAYVGSAFCGSCHSSGYGTSAWPHLTSGDRFLGSAADASAASGDAADSNEDGVCLRCHRDGAANGVGLTY